MRSILVCALVGGCSEEPRASRLLSKAIHDGPSLTDSEIERLLRWIEFAGAGL